LIVTEKYQKLLRVEAINNIRVLVKTKLEKLGELLLFVCPAFAKHDFERYAHAVFDFHEAHLILIGKKGVQVMFK
jgi:hypothetical protein